MFELIHTSAPRGLIEGRSGYTPVAWTEGFPINLLPLIENLSAYDFVSSSPDAAAKTPELYSYRKIKFGAGELRVVSRIAFAGLDYSGRVNKIAHHLIFTDAAEMARFGGAVRIALATDNFTREFHGEPRLLSPRLPRAAEPTAGGAECWRRFAGDPGWSVVVARAFRDTPERAFFVEFGPECEAPSLLELAAGALELLPSSRADDFTFSTYYTQNEADGGVFLRCVPVKTPAAVAAARISRDRLVSLAHPGPAPILPPEADPQLAPGEACGEPPATAAAPPDEPSAPVKPANATKRKLRILLIALVIVGVVGVLVRVKLSSSSSGENITVVSAAPERPLIPAAAPLIPAAPAPPAGEIAPRITAIASQDGFATDKFTAEESSAIWQSWKNGDQEIALPPVLKSTMRIELEFKPDSPYAALPQDAGEKYIIIDGGSPLKRLELRIADDKLKMSEPEATDTPRRADLAAVRFIDRQGRVMRYEPNAKSSFELAVKDPGQVTVEERKGAMVWVYHPSEPVKILGDLATVIVGGVKLKSVVLRGGSSASTVVRMSTAPFDRYALAFSKFRTASESAGAVRQERNAILEKALAAREGLADLLKLKRYQALLDGLKLSYESTGSTYAAQEKALNDLKLKLGNDGRIDSNKKQPMLKMLADYSEGLSALRVCEPRLTAAVAAEKSAQKAFNAAVAELLKTVNAISPDFGNKLGSHLETQKSLPPPEKCISDWCPKFEVTIKPAEATDRP